MSILSDFDIVRGLSHLRFKLFPAPSAEAIQPASIDVYLGNEFILMPAEWVFDPKDPSTFDVGEELFVPDGERYLPPPNRLLLAHTLECVTLDLNHVARVEGKSSLGRIGQPVHVTAGFIDPGWDGYITLELAPCCGLRMWLYPGMPIGQLAIERLSSKATHGYSGKYQQSSGPQRSAYWKNWDGERWR